MKQLRILVSGRVQGVGFRYFAQRYALDLGIKGYAKNLDNGKVEIMAMAEAEKLENFMNSLRKGNRFCRVTDLEVTPIDEPLPYRSFSIK